MVVQLMLSVEVSQVYDKPEAAVAPEIEIEVGELAQTLVAAATAVPPVGVPVQATGGL